MLLSTKLEQNFLEQSFKDVYIAVSGLPEYCSIFHFPPFVCLSVRHGRDNSTFLDNLMVWIMKTIYFLNAYHPGWSSWPYGSPGTLLPPWPNDHLDHMDHLDSPVQPSKVHYSPVEPSAAQYSIVQSTTIQYQPSTVQLSLVQPSTVHYSPK